MADGKWISDLEPTTPLADAARHVLSLRLGLVRHYLPLAMHRSEEDPEHVHQLRVSTRRAGAALDIFSCCLSDKQFARGKKTLRRIRRAAGAARDWDVFLMGLAPVTPPFSPKGRGRNEPGRDLLVGYAVAQRAAAQSRLEEASPNYPFDFERFLAETVADVHKPKADAELCTLTDLARPMLVNLWQELHDAASGDLTDYEHLHQVRITGKRLRYAMEVFAACFDPPFREQLYPAVEHMQEILGQANDSHVAGQRLAALLEQLPVRRPDDWRRYKPGLDALRRRHDERVKQQQQQFIEWWAEWQKPGGEDSFAALVKSEADGQAAMGSGIRIASSQ
jgi:CHAD domain-containing protein